MRVSPGLASQAEATRGSAIKLGTELLARLIGLATTLLLARRLGPADFGAFGTLSVIAVVLAEAADLRALAPPRSFGSHKGTFGHLLVLAGSEGKTGAAALASVGGLRAGAGLVTLGIAASLNDILEAKLTEAMTLPLPQAAGARALGREADFYCELKVVYLDYTGTKRTGNLY